MKAIVILVMLMLLPMTSAILDSRDAVSDGSLTRGGGCVGGCSSGSSSSEDSPKSGGGGAILTQWIWNGQGCVKQDIISFPVEFGINSTLAPGYVEVQYNFPVSEGKKWVSRIYPGEMGIVLNKNRQLVKTPQCKGILVTGSEMSPNIIPLTMGWWRNYFN